MSGRRLLLMFFVIVVLGAFVGAATGCGAPLNSTARTASTRRALVNLRLDQDTARIRRDDAARPADLEAATRAYIGDLQRARQTFGTDAVRALLIEMADGLRYDCPACTAMLDRERRRLG